MELEGSEGSEGDELQQERTSQYKRKGIRTREAKRARIAPQEGPQMPTWRRGRAGLEELAREALGEDCFNNLRDQFNKPNVTKREQDGIISGVLALRTL